MKQMMHLTEAWFEQYGTLHTYNRPFGVMYELITGKGSSFSSAYCKTPIQAMSSLYHDMVMATHHCCGHIETER